MKTSLPELWMHCKLFWICQYLKSEIRKYLWVSCIFLNLILNLYAFISQEILNLIIYWLKKKMVKNHPSIFYLLSHVGSRGQQTKQGGPDFPLPSHFVQLFPRHSLSSVSWVFSGEAAIHWESIYTVVFHCRKRVSRFSDTNSSSIAWFKNDR